MGRYGEGTLFQRANGRWEGRLPDGHGGYRSVTGTDKDEVRARLRQLRRERDVKRRDSERRGGERLGSFLARWLDDVAALRVRARTLHGHRQIVENHLVPRLGRHLVSDLSHADVQRMVTALSADHAPQTVHNIVRVLSSALEQARREELVTVNVARLAVLPQRGREPLPALTTEQLRAFLTATKGEPHWPLWALAAATGMRQGELLALRWMDVDLAAGTLTVAGTLRMRFEGEGRDRELIVIRQEPKTPKSRRTLHLPALARSALEAQKARATSATYVFARPNGWPLDPGQVTRIFQRALVAHGLMSDDDGAPSIRFHSLRHTAAMTMLDHVGGDLRAVSAVLGHASIAITVDRYGAHADEARKRGAGAMDDAMEGMG